MEIVQIIINSLIRASELSLLALGLTMVFDILKFANFAHTDYALLGAFLAYSFSQALGLPLIVSVMIAAGLTGLFGIGIDKVLYKRLRTIGVQPVSLMIVSMGVEIALRNTLRLIWSSETKTYPIAVVKPLEILGARITMLQLEIITVGFLSMVAFHILLHKTTFGKALRAISDNRALASACAIDSEKMIRWMWFIASAYGVIGGTMIAMEHVLYPRLGFNILIPVFCAAILGGIGNPYGAVLGALILAFAENVVLALDLKWLLNLGGLFHFESIQINTGYKPAVSFLILILVLLFKPTGLLRKE